MTVGQFKNTFIWFDKLVKNIRYFDSIDYSMELDPEDIFDNYIVIGYFVHFYSSEVYLYVKAV